MIAPWLAQQAFIIGVFSLTQKAISLSYETIVAKTEPLSWKQTAYCLVSGKGCTIDQRRRAFFYAGRVSGEIGTYAYILLRNYFFKKTQI